MTTMRMIGYRPGLQTVPLIRAIDEHLGMPLADAKMLVEKLVSGEEVVMKGRSSESLALFRRIADELGVQLD